MKKKLFSIATVCLAGILLLGASEILLRIKGKKPWTYLSRDLNEPSMLDFDPVLGWKNKKGQYLIPAYVPGGKDIQMTILSDGGRDTGTIDTDPSVKDELAVVGGSFTQGWAISDNETYAWKLQERFPSLKVLNYGTAAYGTYQSLLVLERELPMMKSPAIVLYGFIDDHEKRNMAPAHWLETLSKHSRRGHVYMPFATLDKNGMLVRHSPERYPETPLREYFATITFIENKFMKLRTMGRESQKQQVTEKLIYEMKKDSERYGAEFIVAILWIMQSEIESKGEYIDYFEKNNIQYVDCSTRITPDMRVPGEGHPNEKKNSLWANCISDSLKKHIDQ